MNDTSDVLTQETTVTSPKIPSYQNRLRSRCSTEWLAAEAMYRYIDKDDHRDRAWDMNQCRTDAWFIRHRETGEVSVVANHCGLRWCPLCAQARANYIQFSLSEWLQKADHPKFLTLTLKHSDEPLPYQVNKLYGAFRRLRRYAAFNKLVTGGVWFFQICRNTQRGQWHPHLHCIVTGAYIPYQKIRALWRKITSDSDICDIKIVTDPERAAREVARYASRPTQLNRFGVRVALELYEAMHGKRLCGKWGLFTKVELSVKKNPAMKDWEKIGSWSLVTAAAESSADARAILEAYELRKPLEPDVSLQEVDDFLDGKPNVTFVEYTFDKPPPEKTLFSS